MNAFIFVALRKTETHLNCLLHGVCERIPKSHCPYTVHFAHVIVYSCDLTSYKLIQNSGQIVTQTNSAAASNKTEHNTPFSQQHTTNTREEKTAKHQTHYGKGTVIHFKWVFSHSFRFFLLFVPFSVQHAV